LLAGFLRCHPAAFSSATAEFTEGFDIRDLKEAKTLLEELNA